MHERTNIQLSRADRGKLEAVVANRNSSAKACLAGEDRVVDGGRLRHGGDHARHRHQQNGVWRWQERFMTDGVAGLLRDKTRPSRIPPLEAEVAPRVVAADPGRSAWRDNALDRRRHGRSARASASVRCNASGADMVCSRTGCACSSCPTTRSSPPSCSDIVGLYVDPPAHAVVLSIDEKSQIQALDRTQPGLPMKKGRCGTMTHDYIRHGTTTLFAALNVLDGKVIGRCMQQHRHQEFIRFLNTVEAAVPAGKIVHAIADNYATHKHPKVREWLVRHPRLVFHFTPTSASWLNAVEGYFAKLTKQRLKRGVFRSIVNSKPPSSASSPKPTQTHAPSGGPRTQTKSSPPSKEGTKC